MFHISFFTDDARNATAAAVCPAEEVVIPSGYCVKELEKLMLKVLRKTSAISVIRIVLLGMIPLYGGW